MSKRILTITWKPDVLTIVKHKGSEKDELGNKRSDSHLTTCRSERESFWNVKSKEKAIAIINRRNKREILLAKYGESVIFSAIEFEKSKQQTNK